MKAVLYFSEKQAVLTVAEAGVNGAFVVREQSRSDYSGFAGDEFAQPTEIGLVFSELFSAISRETISKIRSVSIATPAALCDLICDDISIAVKGRRVTQADMQNLLDSVALSVGTNVIISRTAIFYRVDDGVACIDPKGQIGQRLTARVSIISIPHSFIDLLKSNLASIVPNAEFVAIPLAAALYLIGQSERDKTVALISSEKTGTSISIVSGDGIVANQVVDMGYENLISDICIVKDIESDLARELLTHVVLGFTEDGKYEFVFNGRPESFDAQETNEIITARLEVIVESLLRTINQMDSSILDSKIYFFGYLNQIKGCRNYISRELGSVVIPLVCPLLNMHDTEDLVISSVLNFVLFR